MITWKQNLKHLSKTEYQILRKMCYLSKNMYNEAVYNIRQHYFAEGTYLRYEANYSLLKISENYKLLGASVAQQSVRSADTAFKSFFGLLELSKKGKYQSWKIHLPKYLPKDELHFIAFTQAQIKNGSFRIPMSSEMRKLYPKTKIQIKIPEYIKDKHIRQIHIVPKYKGKYFEVRYIFDDVEKEQIQLDSNKALSIDLGVNNFATCVTSEGDSFIIDGRKLKSMNQWYNKEMARLSSIKDHQEIKEYTHLQYKKARKRNNRIQDFIYKSTKYITNYCIKNNIGNIIVGYNDGFQNKVNLGRVNNQNFVMLPVGRWKSRLEYLCNQVGINFILQEESYTSKASFFDNDEIPKWNPLNPVQKEFSGRRIQRGLYRTSSGKLINADVNAALNIMKKSKVVSTQTLYSRGEVITPIRIRIA